MMNRIRSFASEAMAFLIVLVAFLFVAALQVDNHRLSLRPTFLTMWHDASGTLHHLSLNAKHL